MSGTVSDLWALTDNLGSVRDVVDSNGKARIHRNFDAFGNVVDETHYNASGATVTSGQTGYVDEAFAFTGRYFDKATGLQNNLNRWYDPAVGRWTSQDPSGFPAGDANLYRYVGNQPTTNADPDGLKRRLCFFWGHGYIETVSSDGDRIFLQFGPGWFGEEGYNVTDYVLPTGFPISEWMNTTDADDQYLINLWRELEKDRQSGKGSSWNPAYNCWVPVIMFMPERQPKPTPPVKPWTPPTDPIYTKPWWGVK